MLFFLLREAFVEEFKNSIKCNNSDGEKIWNAFLNINSELLNHWLPHFEIKSGEDLNDAFERMRTHAYAYRANRTIRAANCRAALEDPDAVMLPEKTFENAPEGASGNIPLEISVFKNYYDHAIFHVNQRHRGEE